MNSMMEAAIRDLALLNMGGPRPVIEDSVSVQGVRTETDRKIAAVELGLPVEASWERINQAVEADNCASPHYRR